MAEIKRHTKRSEFVDSRVICIPVTDEIITKIMGHFPTTARVISGYLSEEQLYWKINYHWEYLLDMIKHCLTLTLTERQKSALQAISQVLLSNVPNPSSGYKSSNTPGLPKDQSTHEEILQRHKLLRQSKKDFAAVVEAADLKSKSKRSSAAFALASAPVASPAKGKHGTGYALDIKGNNAEIASLAKQLGATLVFDEDSHVHVEFAKGVSARTDSSAVKAAECAKMYINSKITNTRHGAIAGR